MLCVAALFILFPPSLAMIYLDVQHPNNIIIVQITISIFMIIAFSQAFDGMRNVLIGNLRGLFDRRFPMVIGLVTIWLIGIPPSYLFAFTLHYGAVGFVTGSALGMI